MMRSFFLKIVASASLLLGLLGPQVASGAQVSKVQEPAPPANVEVVVVESQPTQTIAVNEVVSDCGAVSGFLDRMDLLIWQACGDLAVTDSFVQPELSVVTTPEFIPEVAVDTSQPGWFAHGSLRPVNNTPRDTILPAALIIGYSKANNQNVVMANTEIASVQFIPNNQNTFTTIAMRC